MPHPEPTAHPDAVVQAGRARFTVLTPRLLRLEWSGDGRFDDRASFAAINRRFEPPPDFELRRAGAILVIDTGPLRLSFTDDQAPFNSRNLVIEFEVAGTTHVWHPGDPPSGSLPAARRELDNAYRPVALRTGILSRDGWALIDDSGGFRFGGGGVEQGWAEAPLPPGDPPRCDWYFFGHGHDFAAALRDFIGLSGAPPLPPRYALGVWYSRFLPYSAADLRRIVGEFDSHDVPLDVVVLDMDWHTPESWSGYTWNRALFPDPPAFLAWLHERGLRVTLNLHPAQGVLPHEEVWPAFAREMGVDPSAPPSIPFRLTDRRFAEAYFTLLHRPLEAQGVDFWWIDWQQGTRSELDGLDPLAWLNHLHWRDLARDGRRPLLLSRWPGLGGHRHPLAFSGDAVANWEMLAFEVRFTARAAGAGPLLWSHDIGGHFAGDDPELFARWIQFGAVSPCLRLHGSRDPRSERRPWAFGEPVLNAAREAIRLRYRLLPYLYGCLRESCDSGLPLCRPMELECPEAESAYLARGQYLLGDRLLAIPIVRPADPAPGKTGAGSAGMLADSAPPEPSRPPCLSPLSQPLASVDGWLPPGVWIDVQTLETHNGPGWIRLVGGLDRLPLFARAGSVIPVAPPIRRTADLPRDRLLLDIYPGADGLWRCYEDDGATQAWRDVAAEWTPVELSWRRGECRLTVGPVDPRGAGFPACDSPLPPVRNLELRFLGLRRPSSVEVRTGGRILNNNEFQWEYDEAGPAAVVCISAVEKSDPVAVTLRAAGVLSVLTAERNDSLQQTDVRRLLARDHPEIADKRETLTADELAPLAGPAAADALARLGGPFLRAIENTSTQDALATLAHAVIAAPRDGAPIDLRAVWTLHRNGRADRFEQQRESERDAVVLEAPFAARDLTGPAWWTLEVAVHWRGFRFTMRHDGPPLLPSIPLWHLAVVPPDTDPLAAWISGGALNPKFQWEIQRYRHEAAENLCHWFYPAWPDAFWQAPREDDKPTVLAVARIASPNPQSAILQLGDPLSHLQPLSRAEFYWNGRPVDWNAQPVDRNARRFDHHKPPVDQSAQQLTATTGHPRAAVQLRPGINTLAARIRTRSHEYLGLALFTPTGHPLTNIAYPAP